MLLKLLFQNMCKTKVCVYINDVEIVGHGINTKACIYKININLLLYKFQNKYIENTMKKLFPHGVFFTRFC